MTMILIRQAGPYTITTCSERGDVWCNGQRVNLTRAATQSGWAVETGCRGANGKPDIVGLDQAQYAIYAQNRDAIAAQREAAAQAARAANAEQAKLAAWYDGVNEGGEGYNPYR